MPEYDMRTARALLEWQIAMGADEAIGDVPVNRLAPPAPAPHRSPSPPPFPPPQAGEAQGVATAGQGRLGASSPATVVSPPGALAESFAEAAQSARALAAGAASIEALGALVGGFDGCALKRTATTTVFIDGNPAAPIMI